VVVVQDADLEYDPFEFPILLEPILRGWADAVYGSRFLGGPHRVHLFWHYQGNRFLTLLSNVLTDLNLTDMETCYKMVRRDLLETLPLTRDRFGIEPEITARLAQAGARIYELPVTYRGRGLRGGEEDRLEGRGGRPLAHHEVESASPEGSAVGAACGGAVGWSGLSVGLARLGLAGYCHGRVQWHCRIQESGGAGAWQNGTGRGG
jgi:hypothetical protein